MCVVYSAHQDLLYRRTRCLANFESANKKLEQAKAKNKGVQEVRPHPQVTPSLYAKFDLPSYCIRLKPSSRRPVLLLRSFLLREKKVCCLQWRGGRWFHRSLCVPFRAAGLQSETRRSIQEKPGTLELRCSAC